MTYAFTIENFADNYPEIEPLYRQHYQEMADRLATEGVQIATYSPRLDEYYKAANGGWLLNIIARLDGEAIGYTNVYITNDMHNGERIAQEDTVFITKAHRNGVGRRLVKFALEELRQRGVRRLLVTAVTDTRAVPLWRRMGFKEIATQMFYTFEPLNPTMAVGEAGVA